MDLLFPLFVGTLHELRSIDKPEGGIAVYRHFLLQIKLSSAQWRIPLFQVSDSTHNSFLFSLLILRKSRNFELWIMAVVVALFRRKFYSNAMFRQLLYACCMLRQEISFISRRSFHLTINEEEYQWLTDALEVSRFHINWNLRKIRSQYFALMIAFSNLRLSRTFNARNITISSRC